MENVAFARHILRPAPPLVSTLPPYRDRVVYCSITSGFAIHSYHGYHPGKKGHLDGMIIVENGATMFEIGLTHSTIPIVIIDSWRSAMQLLMNPMVWSKLFFQEFKLKLTRSHNSIGSVPLFYFCGRAKVHVSMFKTQSGRTFGRIWWGVCGIWWYRQGNEHSYRIMPQFKGPARWLHSCSPAFATWDDKVIHWILEVHKRKSPHHLQVLALGSDQNSKNLGCCMFLLIFGKVIQEIGDSTWRSWADTLIGFRQNRNRSDLHYQQPCPKATAPNPPIVMVYYDYY